MANEKELSPEIERTWMRLYIELQANPLDHRTDKQFVDEIKLPLQTLYVWKRKYRTFLYEEVAKLRKKFISETRALAYKALAKKFDKDTNALKLFFQLTGELVERTESRTEVMDHDTKIRRAKELLASIEAKAAWAEKDEAGNEGHSDKPEPGPGEGVQPTGNP